MLTAANPATADAKFYRPLNDPVTGNGYGDVNQNTNNAYANYNAMQVTWARQQGRYTIQANYTLQKALGIILSNANTQNNGSIAINPFDLRSNYGIQPTDRRHLFNIAYSVDIGNPLHAHGVLAGLTAGWQISGVTQLQSGANLTFAGGYNSSTNFNMQMFCTNPAGTPTGSDPCKTLQNNSAIIPGTANGIVGDPKRYGVAVNNQSILGTNAVQLNPIVTCDPKSGLSSHQFVNANCFAAPFTVGQNGPTLLPVNYGPAFFNSDLGIFKNFNITESKRLQFRVQAYNFLNHPLWSFPDSSNLTLKFSQDPFTQQFTQTNANFGKTTVKQGGRVVEFAVKFFF